MASKRMERIQAALEALRKEGKGRLTAERIVRAAAAKSHPLHGEFIWDDKRAAHRQRLNRARELISYVTIVVVHRPNRILAPYYVRDPRSPPDVQGHIAITDEQIRHEDAHAIMLAELARIEGNIERARGAAAQLGKRFGDWIIDDLEMSLDKLIALRARLAASPPKRRRRGKGRAEVTASA